MTRPGKPYSAKTNTSSARRLTTVPAQAHPRIAFIGAGRVGRSLACAFQRAGVPVVGYVARDQKSAPEDTAGDGLLAGIPRLSLAEAALQADWLWLTVPDDHIAHVADTIAWRDHHVAVHCSGATELTAMRSAQNAGAALSVFTPCRFSPNRALPLTPCQDHASVLRSPMRQVRPRSAAHRKTLRPRPCNNRRRPSPKPLG